MDLMKTLPVLVAEAHAEIDRAATSYRDAAERHAAQQLADIAAVKVLRDATVNTEVIAMAMTTATIREGEAPAPVTSIDVGISSLGRRHVVDYGHRIGPGTPAHPAPMLTPGTYAIVVEIRRIPAPLLASSSDAGASDQDAGRARASSGFAATFASHKSCELHGGAPPVHHLDEESDWLDPSKGTR